jgi:alkanesulfonate monooxygenase SsuD/methylene tetrahydromethanopterin reductase-like flavin-dependent oxidoreductase (luciferase family)
MRLGLYYDLRNPGAGRPWARVYAAALDRIAWADDEGLGAIWVTEHHGFADGYLPAPLTFCAAIAARTRWARIGTAVVVSPLMPAAALAEQAAVVDILSDGRLELGLGAGWRASEFTAFGADYRHRYEALEEAVRSLPDLWDSGTVTPGPVQRPLPVWIGARGPRGARLAGRTGAGLLWIDPDLMPPYLAALATADRPAAFPKLHVCTPAAAAAYVIRLCAGLPVTDVFCFADIGGLDDDLVDRHTELAVRELTPLLAEEGELS